MNPHSEGVLNFDFRENPTYNSYLFNFLYLGATKRKN